MSRLQHPALDQAPEAARPLFDQIRKAMGKVPRAYALIGSLSPAALKLMLEGDAALAQGSLSRAELEAVRLAISAQNGCDYCVAAHSMVGQLVGLQPEELRRLRGGEAVDDARRAALVAFARHVAGTRGTVAPAQVQAFIEAGFTPSQVIEVLLAITLIGFTNLVNRVNDTTPDFPVPA